MACEPEVVQQYTDALDQALLPMLWTHDILETSCHFIDLQIDAVHSGDYVRFDFSLYRKPGINPQYLVWFSDHRQHHKKHILNGEATRALIMSSK